MKRLLMLSLLLICLLSLPLSSSVAAERIHPFTQQMTDQWAVSYTHLTLPTKRIV